MAAAPKILAFSGSARTGSLNKKLIRVGADAARVAGADVTLIDLRDFPLPIYDGDLEQREGVPPNALKLKELMMAHQGLLIASPENNSSVSSLLKNTIDWISRPTPTQDGAAPYRGKVAALLAASPGALGGLRGLVHLRVILANLGVLMVSEQFALVRAAEAFGEDGALIDPRQQAVVVSVTTSLISLVSKLHAA